MVAPALFATLEDRALAGTLAGVMFNIIAWVGLACGSLLLLFNQLHHSEKRLNLPAVVLMLMLALTAVGQFVLAPKVAAMRVEGLAGSEAFATMHGIASVAYLLTSVLGLVLVVVREDS
jgi:vacuolar-type H+-ATPase subunit I/STV1